MNESPLRRPAVLAGGLLGLSAFGACLFAMVRGSLAEFKQKHTATAAGKQNPADGGLDPARVMGAKACVECHKAEFARWRQTVHYSNDERLETEAAVKYGKALGIAEADIARNSLCTTCHATTQKQENGEIAAISGVSCESCHGGSGGDPGWLNRHAVYGPEGTRREQETEAHRQARLQFCREQGLTGPRDLYGVAKKCFGCHIVGNEKLVDAAHKAGSLKFEFASWSNGEIRHNFHLDQMTNAPVSSLWLNPVGRADKKKREAAHRRRMMFVLGLLVDLETSLRNRARAKGAAYAGQMAARIGPMQGTLAQINAATELPETRQVASLLPALFARLFTVGADDEKYFSEQADKVAGAAKSFLANHDGSKLQALDAMIPEKHFSEDYAGEKD